MYKYFTLLFFVLLSIQLVSKPQNKKNKIPQKLPIYVETHINSSDSIFNCIISYRIPLNNLVFIQQNDSYYSNFAITFEIYENKKFIKRLFKDNKVNIADYSSTISDNLFSQGIVTTNLPKGKYVIKPLLTLGNTEIEVQIKPIDFEVDSNQVHKPIFVENLVSSNETYSYSLVNFQNSILFTNNEIHMLVPITQDIDSIDVEICQNNKTVFDETISETIFLNNHFFESNGEIVFSKMTKMNFAKYVIVEQVNKKLMEGEVDIKIKIGDESLNFSSNVFWSNKPKSLNNIEEAIKYLNIIGYKKDADSLYNISEDNQYSDLFNFWKKFDEDTTNSFNEVLDEFYSRIDFIQSEFNTLSKEDAVESDRGKVYLIFGKPDSMERKFNDVYDVVEVWEYKSIDKTIYFADKTGTGKFERIK